ncbi:MAG: hypothetical protein PSX36_04970 [bacterium]|nr:hypothetical protein [bacterium]
MIIAINDNRKLYAVQEEFTQQFPFLKLEFFSKPSKPGAGSSKKIIGHSSKTIGECRTIHDNGNISISPEMTVTELEQRFSDVYGLHVQLLRKAGNVWLETSVTDGWTLSEQNRQGETLSKDLHQVNSKSEQNQNKD